ncbi:Protein of unknown function DUF3115 [Phaffia rhodozyma]|uniref:Uncharacterized protein n=1 Tax=Phaffia rhodozyma TaxID=264483 RepID=A0A0F7SNY5_PHARH|nr:Protein of unknown function DUF3115 [Phaffia rhodozyma]
MPKRDQIDFSYKQEPLGAPRHRKRDAKPKKERLVKQERVLNAPTGRQAVSAEPNGPSSRNVHIDPKPYLTILSFLGSLSASTISSEKYQTNLQAVKGALFDRDYDRAFGSRSKPDWLWAYVARWVPGRALGYRAMLGDLDEYEGGCAVKAVGKLFEPLEGEQRFAVTKVESEQEEQDDEEEGDDSENDSDVDEGLEDAVATLDLSSPPSDSNGNEPVPEVIPTRTINVLCYGSGPGSEIIALAATTRERGTPAKVHVQAVDSGNWGPILSQMSSGIETEWNLPKSRFEVDFIQHDILKPADATRIDIPRANLITLLYTTHELLTASRSTTIAFLSNLTAQAQPGTLLMIVESAGSFSAMPVGKSEKTFPLEFLLDLVLAGGKDAGPGSRGEWEVVKKSESRWFRVPDGVGKGYPVKLENMRHMLRVYRRRAPVAV